MPRRISLPGGAAPGDLEAAVKTAAALLRQIAPDFRFRVLIDRRTNTVLDGRRVKDALPGSQVRYETIDTDSPELFRHVYNLMSRPITPDQRAMTAVIAFLKVVRDAAERNRQAGTTIAPENQAGDTRDVLRFLAGGIPRHFVDDAQALWNTPHGDLVDSVLRGSYAVADARLAARAREVLPDAKSIFEDKEIGLTRAERATILDKLSRKSAESLTSRAIADMENAAHIVRKGLRNSALGNFRAGAKNDRARDVRLTPTDIVEAVRWAFDGQIAFDAASSWSNPTDADRYASLDAEVPLDGSTAEWPDCTFVNPPYSHRKGKEGPGGIDEFIDQAIRMRDADHRPRIYMLLPVHPETEAGRKALSECSDALFFSDRLIFDTPDAKGKRKSEIGSAFMANVIVGFNATTLLLADLLRGDDGLSAGIVMTPIPRPMSRAAREAMQGESAMTGSDWQMLAESRERELAAHDESAVRAMLDDAEVANVLHLEVGRKKVQTKRAEAERLRKAEIAARKRGKKKS